MVRFLCIIWSGISGIFWFLMHITSVEASEAGEGIWIGRLCVSMGGCLSCVCRAGVERGLEGEGMEDGVW